MKKHLLYGTSISIIPSMFAAMVVPYISLYSSEFLNLSVGMIGIVVSTYYLVQVLIRIPLGSLSDVIGYKNIIALGGFAAFSASSLYILSRLFWPLIFLAQASLGIALSITWVTIPAFMTRFGRGKIPVYTFIVGWAYTLSVPLAGFLKDELGMISIFILTLILAIPLTILIALLWRNYPEKDPGKEIEIKTILSEYKKSFKKIKSAKMIRACGFSFLFFMGFGISLSLFPLYLSGIGLTSFLIGIIQFSRMSCGSSIRIFSDNIINKLSQEKTLTTGALIVGACMTIIPHIENLPLLITLSIIWGLSGGLYSPIVFELIADATKAEDRGKGMGLRGTFGTLGSLIGVLSFSNIAEMLGIPLAISATGISFILGTITIETLLHIYK